MGGEGTGAVSQVHVRLGTSERRTPPLGGPTVFRTRDCKYSVTEYLLPEVDPTMQSSA